MAGDHEGRLIDAAMASQRPEKVAVREIWADKVEALDHHHGDEDELFYLTLSGAEGRDIELLVDRDVFQLTEVGSLAQSSQERVVAVENSPQAILRLQKKYPGLKIVDRAFQDLVRGPGMIRFPERRQVQMCRARVVNLDLNSPLFAEVQQGRIVFPVIQWIAKLALLHAEQPRRTWSLFLTLHGEAPWADDIAVYVQRLLVENFAESAELGTSSEDFLGIDLYGQVTDQAITDFQTLDREDQQKMLMLFAPKTIATVVREQGWSVTTEHNLRYGQAHHAPMVTWVMNFSFAEGVPDPPQQQYRNNIRGILDNAGSIDGDGLVVSDLDE